MEDLNLTTTRPKINLQVTDEAGVEHAHSFEILPLNKPRYEAVLEFAAKGAALDQDDESDRRAAAPMIAEFCDKMLRSTNGPVTISSLWEDGLLPFPWVLRVAEHLQKQAVGDPPA